MLLNKSKSNILWPRKMQWCKTVSYQITKEAKSTIEKRIQLWSWQGMIGTWSTVEPPEWVEYAVGREGDDVRRRTGRKEALGFGQLVVGDMTGFGRRTRSDLPTVNFSSLIRSVRFYILNQLNRISPKNNLVRFQPHSNLTSRKAKLNRRFG